MACFSSRGPSLSSGGDLLKPDIMAPGVDVVAAVSPANHAGNLYDTESGTSMATPHIAGIAALHHQQAPGLVADVGQVGHDDHRQYEGQQGQPDPGRPATPPVRHGFR